VANKKSKRRAAGTGAIFKNRHGVYVYQWRAGARLVTKTLRTKDRAEAEARAKELFEPGAKLTDESDFLNRVERVRVASRAHTVTLAGAWAAFLKTRPTAGPGTLKNYRRAFEDFRAWLANRYPAIGDLAAVSDDIAGEYLAELWQGGISASTFNYRKNALGLLHKALKATGNPWHKRELRRREVKGGREPLTVEHVTELLRRLDDPATAVPHREESRVLFKTLLFTGARFKDAVLLQWGAVDLGAGRIAYTPAKTARTAGKRAEVPILEPLRAELETMHANRDPEEPYVFPRLAEVFRRNPDGVHTPLRALLLNVTGDGKAANGTDGAQRKISRAAYGLHSCRHSFASWAAQAGAPPALLALMLGDRAATVDRYYVRVGLGAATLPAFRDIPRLTSGTAGRDAEPERARLRRAADELPLSVVRDLLRAVESREVTP
jgi:integrase